MSFGAARVSKPTVAHPYSDRSASTGFTDAALRAGMKLATSADTARTAATDTIVATSQERTPNSKPLISVAAASEPARPKAMPTTVNHPASLRISP